jgi:hypothetical protein
MDTSGSTSVAHGLTYANIRRVSAIIRNDADTNRYNIAGINSSGTEYGSIYTNSTNVICMRSPSGQFDSTDFDATSYNRGWIVVEYV